MRVNAIHLSALQEGVCKTNKQTNKHCLFEPHSVMLSVSQPSVLGCIRWLDPVKHACKSSSNHWCSFIPVSPWYFTFGKRTSQKVTECLLLRKIPLAPLEKMITCISGKPAVTQLQCKSPGMRENGKRRNENRLLFLLLDKLLYFRTEGNHTRFRATQPGEFYLEDKMDFFYYISMATEGIKTLFH